MAVHVRYNSWYISLLSSAKQQREITKFCVVWRERGPWRYYAEEFENEGFTLKTHQMFSVNTSPLAERIWKRKKKTRLFGFMVEENSGVTFSFSQSFVFNKLSVHSKAQSRRFQIPPGRRAFSESFFFVMD